MAYFKIVKKAIFLGNYTLLGIESDTVENEQIVVGVVEGNSVPTIAVIATDESIIGDAIDTLISMPATASITTTVTPTLVATMIDSAFLETEIVTVVTATMEFQILESVPMGMEEIESVVSIEANGTLLTKILLEQAQIETVSVNSEAIDDTVSQVMLVSVAVSMTITAEPDMYLTDTLIIVDISETVSITAEPSAPVSLLCELSIEESSAITADMNQLVTTRINASIIENVDIEVLAVLYRNKLISEIKAETIATMKSNDIFDWKYKL